MLIIQWKGWSFNMKKILLALILMGFFLQVSSQIIYSDTSKKWYRPNHIVLQYAGDFGFLSGGVGFDFVDDKISIDFLVGYVPASIGGIDIYTLNLKSVYKPFHYRINKNITVVPFNIGFISSHAMGSQYNKTKSGIYPDGYYWWPANNRVGPSFGQNYYYSIEKKKHKRVIEFYWDFVANDLGLYTYFDNKEAKLYHIFSFDCGLKWYF